MPNLRASWLPSLNARREMTRWVTDLSISSQMILVPLNQDSILFLSRAPLESIQLALAKMSSAMLLAMQITVRLRDMMKVDETGCVGESVGGERIG